MASSLLAPASSATFDLTANHTSPLVGLTRAERAAMSGDALIKFKEVVVTKKIFPKKLDSLEIVTSFDPAEFKQSNNFFHFVSTWREDVKCLKQALAQYYLLNVFTIVYINEQVPVMENGQPKKDGNGDQVYESKVFGSTELLELWHTISAYAVEESCRIYFNHAEDVDRQNLIWSGELIMNNVSEPLRRHISGKLENLPNWCHSGPMIFHILAHHVVNGNNQVTHNILTGLSVMELRHFDGEDANSACMMLQHILKFLNYGVPGFDRAPTTMKEMILDVFERASNSGFRAYVRTLRNFHKNKIRTPDEIFTAVSEQYRDMISKPGTSWLPTKKGKAAFVTQADQSKAEVTEQNSTKQTFTLEEVQKLLQAVQCQPVTAPAESQTPPKKRAKIDRTPPKEGEPHVRINEETGKEEFWCGTCPNGGRWGNHLDAGHEKWLK